MKVKNLLLVTVILLLAAWASYYNFDIGVIEWINQHRTANMILAGKIVQHAFSYVVWVVIGAVALLLIWRRSKNMKMFFQRPATQFFLSIFLAMAICLVLKTAVGRYRPEMYLTQHLFGFVGYAFHQDLLNSMPSDHSAIIFAIITTLALFIRKMSVTIILVVLGLLLISLRVVYLRHFPSDVLIGMLVGVWAASFSAYFCNRFR